MTKPDFQTVAHKAHWAFVGGQSTKQVIIAVNHDLEPFDLELKHDFNMADALGSAEDVPALASLIETAVQTIEVA